MAPGSATVNTGRLQRVARSRGVLGRLLFALTLAVLITSASSARSEDRNPPPHPARARRPAPPADIGNLIGALGARSVSERERATEALYAIGDPTLDALGEAATSDDPEVRDRAQRLAWRIRWKVSRELLRTAGPLLDGFDVRPRRARRDAVLDIASGARDTSLDFLVAVFLRDPDNDVKVQALRSFTALGGWTKRREALLSLPPKEGLELARVGIVIGANTGDLYFVAARILAREKRREEAIGALTQAFWRGFGRLDDLDAAPELAGLRDDPRVLSERYSYRGLRELRSATKAEENPRMPDSWTAETSDPEAEKLNAQKDPDPAPGADPVKDARRAWWRRAQRSLLRAVRLNPQNAVAWYNLACAYSLQDRSAPAVDALKKSVDAGYEDYRHMEEDSDLDNIRSHPGYREVLERLRMQRSR